MAMLLRSMPRGLASRSFSTMSREEVFSLAQKIHSVPFDKVKEPTVTVPVYEGLTPELSSYLSKSPPAGYTTPPRQVRPTKIANNALELVGNTPMIQMDRIRKVYDVEPTLLGKAEYFSAGGSVKDRIALRMIEDGEREGKLKPGDTLIEATSGNTGVGLCMAGAIKGYNVIITLPMKMSGEKVNMMKALGALILRTPNEASWDADESHIILARRIKEAIGARAHVLDQYANKGNVLAHYDTTAEEILEQTGGDFTHLVMTAGTGGTFTGIARKIKEKAPHVTIVAVDPVGSILAVPDSMNDHKRLEPYHVEGIGYDFIPAVCEQGIADVWVKSVDDKSFQACRAMIRHEGMMIGGSCGSALHGAVDYIKSAKLGKDAKVVVLFADATRNYMSKFLCDDWMKENGFGHVVENPL
jgi:cystathionine beta-synthase